MNSDMEKLVKRIFSWQNELEEEQAKFAQDKIEGDHEVYRELEIEIDMLGAVALLIKREFINGK